jgi:threonine dehydrogenase-like Zn-dependent dehydrogenase
MKAVIYHAHDDIHLEEVPLPVCDSRELIMRVHGYGLCGSDILKVAQHIPLPDQPGTRTDRHNCGSQRVLSDLKLID